MTESFCRVFVVAVFALSASLSPPLARAAPAMTAKSYILMDATTGAVLAEHNADERLPPASLTKIMTAYVAFAALKDGRLTMEREALISENAWAANVVGSKMFLEVNTKASTRDLLRGIIIQSGNDASIALAEMLAGDEAAFAAEMNAAGEKMGLRDSAFRNATGLPSEGHHTSARDTAIIARHTILEFPELYRLYAEPEFSYNDIRQPNRNGLLSSFTGADGIKTGYTKEAGYCLAASATRDGRRLIAVVMKTDSPKTRERESAKLLTYGFNAFINHVGYEISDRRQLPLWKGEKAQIAVRPQMDGVVTVPREETARAVFSASAPLVAPIGEGDVVGELRLLSGDDILLKTPLVAAESVAAGGLWRRLADATKLRWRQEEDDELLSEW